MTDTSGPREADDRRDDLLAVARAVAGRAGDPTTVIEELHAAWAAHTIAGMVIEDDFTLDPSTGVEALALLVPSDHGPAAGGLVLRLPGELPDSFEAVSLPERAQTGAAVHRVFFG